MIRFRHSVFQSHLKDTDQKIEDGELLSKAIETIFEEIDLGESEIKDVFVVSVNGKQIASDFWDTIALKETDDVVISPNLQSGDAGSIFKQIALIIVVVVATILTEGLDAPAIAAIVGASTLAASLILNALIPPPVDSSGLNTGDELSQSQMYAISGQSNQTKKFGTVPKVYGNFRMFPNVAANPYTELQTDSSGNLSQFLYAIYDFGLGPIQVTDLLIGDTPIDDFTDVEVRIVDFNKPAISEGPWDDESTNSLTWYMGDRSVDSAAVSINYNQADTSYLPGYEIKRTSSVNPNGDPMEIQLPFVASSGLYAYDQSGNLGSRQINLKIQFRTLEESQIAQSNPDYGEEYGWKAWNDQQYVSTFSVEGGSPGYLTQPVGFFPAPHTAAETAASPYTVLSTDVNSNAGPLIAHRAVGYPTGTTQIWVNESQITSHNPTGVGYSYPNPAYYGVYLYVNGSFIGRIAGLSKIQVGQYAGYRLVTLDRPLTSPLVVVNQYMTNPPSDNNPYGYSGQYDLSNWPNQAGYTNGYARAGGDFYDGNLYFNYGNIGIAAITTQYRDGALTTQPTYTTIKFAPLIAQQYEVRIIRTSSSSANTYRIVDALTLAGVVTRFDRTPITTSKRHAFLELKIKATNQLNGTISNLSARCQSALDVYDPGTQTWSKQLTTNPAWVFCDLLTGEVNKRAIDKSRLDMDSILAWRDYCDAIPTPPPNKLYVQPRFQTNFVLDYVSTLQNVIKQVTSSCQASLNLVDGKYGVLLDVPRSTPTQVFTPRNSKSFSSSRNFMIASEGISVQWIDPQSDWSTVEVPVYNNGIDSSNVTTDLESLVAFGCTNVEQAYRFGRYMIAQNLLRQETMSIQVDFEQLICSRGDYVQITQDVMKVGGTPARVIRADIPSRTIVIDDAIDIDESQNYGYVARSSTTGLITTNTLQYISPDTFVLSTTDMPQAGDLIVIGVVGSIVYDCLVKSIVPNDDLSATITLVERQAEIYDYESTGTFPAYTSGISPVADHEYTPPPAITNLAVADQGYTCDGQGFHYYVDLIWSAPSNAIYVDFEIYLDTGSGASEIDAVRTNMYRYLCKPSDLNKTLTFWVVAVSPTGLKRALGTVPNIPVVVARKATPPSDVVTFTADIGGNVLQLYWTPIPDCGTLKYVIRYAPSLTATWEQATSLMTAPSNATSVTTQARTGSYFIKAVDFENNESANAEAVITTIPNLLNVNVVQTISDSPGFVGTKSLVVKTGDNSLELDQTSTNVYYSEGFYYFKEILDLQDIYTCKLSAAITAQGFSGAGVFPINYGDWSVEMQYRGADNVSLIRSWTNLSSVLSMASGTDNNYTDWRVFTASDVTARFFQFRARLISNRHVVTPKVSDITITVDMPDRTETYNNLSASASSDTVVSYSPSFAGPDATPNVQITLEDGQSGDYWAFGYRTLDGFSIRFFDKNGVRVARQFDASVKGYGYKANSTI